jgi:tRNA G18 (ribose-2'-O)-methylase SpoU
MIHAFAHLRICAFTHLRIGSFIHSFTHLIILSFYHCIILSLFQSILAPFPTPKQQDTENAMRKLRNSELERKTVQEFKATRKYPVYLVLDNVRSLNNVGSAFRTADAFLIKGICLCGITARPPHRDIQKTALGATESVDWIYYPQTVKAVNELKESGYRIISVEQTEDDVSLPDLTPSRDEKYALVFGHEVKGVQQEIVDMSDLCVEIPQEGTKHSFNISVSVGIVLYHFYYHLR